MTTASVLAPQSETVWSRPEEPLLIGKDILELLSTSMYIDPMSMYREYIQNSADAVELARLQGVLEGPGRVEIQIDPSARVVFIRDNGVGLGLNEFIHHLTALGGSNKRGTKARGFRGVGRLAGLAFCQELIFRSRQEGEDTVHELRWDSRKVRSLLRSSDNSCDLAEVVAQTVQTREVRERNCPQRFFEVELRGMIRHRDDRLLNEDRVSKYLAQVAPVPFSDQFLFRDRITSFLAGHSVQTGTIDIDIVGRGPVCRPHSNSVAMGKSGETRFQELMTIQTPGRNGTVAAVTWILHHDYLGALPVGSLVDGWRVRCGDIQVGDNALLQNLFPESRFNGWCVAETHVLDGNILPNGRRDHFEHNAFYFDLINHLAPYAREIAQRCRVSSIGRNLVRTIDAKLAECQKTIRVIKKGFIGDASAGKIKTKIENMLNHLNQLLSRPGIDTERKLQYEREIKRLRQAILRLNKISPVRKSLANFGPSQRPILRQVFNTIYQSSENIETAQRLINKIMAGLSRTRANGKK